MATDKNQHYVPQFYLRYFSSDGKNVGVYLLEENKLIKNGPIKNQASESYFYVKEKAKESEQNLASLERKIKETLDKIVECKGKIVKLKLEEKETLLVSVAFQYCRTKSAANMWNTLVDKISKEVLRRDFKLGLSEENLSKILISIKNPAAFGIAHTLEPAIKAITDLHYKFVSIADNTNVKLLTSDNPVAIYNPFYERIGMDSIGLASKGLILYMPISPYCGVIYYDDNTYKMGNKKSLYVEIGEDDILQLNRIAALNANKCLFFMPSVSPTYMLEDIGKSIVKFKGKEKIESVSSNMSIIGMSHKLPTCRAKLSFLKELDKAKGIMTIGDMKRMGVPMYRKSY